MQEEYSYRNGGEYYVVYHGNTPVKTPKGRNVDTSYKNVAERLVEDFSKFGNQWKNNHSIISWHITLLDMYLDVLPQEMVALLEHAFLRFKDWTFYEDCQEEDSGKWHECFGTHPLRREMIRCWLRQCSNMQLSAILCIASEYDSLNLVYAIAKIICDYPFGTKRDCKFRELAVVLHNNTTRVDENEFYRICKNFELYYGIHEPEMDKGILAEKEMELRNVTLDTNPVVFLLGKKISRKVLAGRNFYSDFLSCWIREPEFPFAFHSDFKDFRMYSFEYQQKNPSESVKENDCNYEDMDFENENPFAEFERESLYDLLPACCWAKIYQSEDKPHEHYVLFLSLDDNDVVNDVGLLKSMADQSNAPFEANGTDMYQEMFFEEMLDETIPPFIVSDIQNLVAGKGLPLDYSPLGKTLPPTVLARCHGAGTKFSISKQSAYRPAYTTFLLDTDEHQVVKHVSYVSYVSSGDGFLDMVSRPQKIDTMEMEYIDFLLELFDAENL